VDIGENVRRYAARTKCRIQAADILTAN